MTSFHVQYQEIFGHFYSLQCTRSVNIVFMTPFNIRYQAIWYYNPYTSKRAGNMIFMTRLYSGNMVFVARIYTGNMVFITLTRLKEHAIWYL
jgi:hypothetical protein